MLDIGQLGVPGAHERRAHRAQFFALRSEHVAVDDQRLLVAEQIRESDLAALAVELVLFRHLAARRQRAAQFRDAFDVTAQFDLLSQELRACAAILRAFVGEMHLAGAGEFGCGFQGWTVHGNPRS